MYSHLEKIEENLYDLQIDQEADVCMMIFTYIALYANSMKIINITQSKSTLVDDSTIYYFHLTIEGDRNEIRKLNNYLHE
jgi:hypothetical protein